MDKQFIDEIAEYIRTILCSGGPVTWSWGVDRFRATEYRNMAALRFSVIGAIHKGDVVVAYNQGADTFEVFCLGDGDTIVSSNDDVYLDELLEVIDRFVERNGSDA
jgi:hypothetical protein